MICPTCQGEWTVEKAKKLDEEPPPTGVCPNCSGVPNEPFDPHWRWDNARTTEAPES